MLDTIDVPFSLVCRNLSYFVQHVCQNKERRCIAIVDAIYIYICIVYSQEGSKFCRQSQSPLRINAYALNCRKQNHYFN